MPGGFDGIEFRCVGRQLLQVQPRIPVAELAQPLGMMDRGPIPDHKDVPAQMLEQIPKEVLDLIARDVLGVKLEIEPQSTPTSDEPSTKILTDPNLIRQPH